MRERFPHASKKEKTLEEMSVEELEARIGVLTKELEEIGQERVGVSDPQQLRMLTLRQAAKINERAGYVMRKQQLTLNG